MKIIIDCSYVAHRSFYGMTDLSYNQKKVHIIYDFVHQLLILTQRFESKDFLFCFDSRESWRKIYDPNYKGNRDKDREAWTKEKLDDFADMHRQIVEIKRIVLPQMGFKNIFEQNGYEGDDIIARIVLDYCDHEDSLIVVANDKDLYQLLRNNVVLWNFKRKFTKENFEEEYCGLSPDKWATVKALAGCSGDNVVGIVGIGDKTAAKFLMGKLNKGKTRDKMESKEGKEIKDFNLPLVLLPYEGKKKLRKFEAIKDEISIDKFRSLFGQYGFRYWLKDDQWQLWEAAFFI